MADPNEPRFFNRELSWLEFNQRVLDQAHDPSLPLLERLKFLAISGSNLDEFASVRLGTLQGLLEEGRRQADAAGLTPEQQSKVVLGRMRQFVADQYLCFLEELTPALTKAGIRRVLPHELTATQSQIATAVFRDELFPILSPMAIDPEAESPLLMNLALHLAVRLAPTEASGTTTSRFALIPFGRQRQRFITVPGEGGAAYVLLEDVVMLHVGQFFPGETVVEAVPFRITRNADVELREDSAVDLLAGMQEILDARKVSECVRLEMADQASFEIRGFLQDLLHVDSDDMFLITGPLELSAFMRLTGSQGFDHLKDEPWPPVASPQIDPARSMFETIAERDVLLYHPYESFEPVVRLIEEAAVDPDVLAIKQTLYRTSARSPIVAAMKRAAMNGKYVTALVELKARFDEARNIEWAKDLERNGVQVIYGVKGLKTHAKICLIVRREPQGIVRYMHFGTGNYNEQTALLYSDASLMTCDEELGADATSFFHAITGYSQPQRFQKLEAAPISLRDRLLEMIDIEINNKKQGRKALILIKLNALVDERMIEALYQASQAGVKVRLSIRGVCCLRPGVPGLSENLTVSSVIDRFLEHSRLLYFYHGGDDRLFISSADWMPRNLDRRVELLVPVEDSAAKARLLSILKLHMQDTAKGRRLLPDGRYERVVEKNEADRVRSQAVLYRQAQAALQALEQQPVSMFEPHRAPGQEL
ncbi:MAG: polyphosphate kinase 1 [Planctomycetaceae bacterium]|nr:polyphosphate kinase 1 [Planctomycetaceae bacterium]